MDTWRLLGVPALEAFSELVLSGALLAVAFETLRAVVTHLACSPAESCPSISPFRLRFRNLSRQRAPAACRHIAYAGVQ